MEFVAYGNAGIEASHTSVIQLTQNTSVMPKGDRVIGTRAAYDADGIAGLAQISKKLKITFKTGTYTEVVTGDSNTKFMVGPEIILRKDATITPGTLVINADRAAADLSRRFIDILKNPEQHLKVTIERID